MKMRENEHINWELLAKDIAGELNDSEHLELQQNLAANPDIEGQVKNLWGDVQYAQELGSIDTNKAWVSVKGQMHQKPVNRMVRWRRYAGLVASLILFFGTVAILSYMLIPSQVHQYAHEDVKSIILPDGTQVDLNLGTSIRYPVEFNTKQRRVRLTGEAFFDVVKNPDKPFIIETPQLAIRVLGTSFNVKAYRDDEESVVTVSTGTVNVKVKEQTDNLTIVAGEEVTFHKASAMMNKSTVGATNYKAWKTLEIEFDKAPFDEVISTLEDVYHIDIIVDESVVVGDMVFGATFSQYSLKHVLESVCTTFHLKYKKTDEGYVIFAE